MCVRIEKNYKKKLMCEKRDKTEREVIIYEVKKGHIKMEE